MRRAGLTVLCLLALMVAVASCQQRRLTSATHSDAPGDDTLRVASWNVHYILANQPEGRWGLAGWQVPNAR